MIRTWTEAELIDMEQIAENAIQYANQTTTSTQAIAGRALKDCIRHIRRLNDRISDLEFRLLVDEELSRG